MVSLPQTLMYPAENELDLAYPTTASAWYQNLLIPDEVFLPNNQFRIASPTLCDAEPSGILDSDTAAATSFTNHHPMLHTPNPEWNSHDNYNLSMPSLQFHPNEITPPTSLHLSPTTDSDHASNGSNKSNDNFQIFMESDNLPPSPPITINSAHSETSSPGIDSNGIIGEISYDIDSNSIDLIQQISPRHWAGKPLPKIKTVRKRNRTKDKRYRSAFTEYQITQLENTYAKTRYATRPKRDELIQSLGLSDRQVKIWFQNRRQKENREKLSNKSLLSTYGIQIRMKLEPELLVPSQHAPNFSYMQQDHVTNPMYHPNGHDLNTMNMNGHYDLNTMNMNGHCNLSTMNMNMFHQSHMHHSVAEAEVRAEAGAKAEAGAESALSPPMSSLPIISIQSHEHL